MAVEIPMLQITTFILILLALAGFTVILAEIILKTGKEIMTSIENLTAAVTANSNATTALATAINNAVAKLGQTAGATDAQLDTITAAVQSNQSNVVSLTGLLNAAVNPPPTPPAAS